MTKRTALAFAALCCVFAAHTASAANLQFAPKPSGPMTKAVNCNPSSITGAYTCKCDTSGGCTYLSIFCAHVTENYYTCEKDETASKPKSTVRQLKLR